MSFDPWHGRRTLPSGGVAAPPPAVPAGRRPGPGTSISLSRAAAGGPTRSAPFHWIVQWRPAGAPPAGGWTVRREGLALPPSPVSTPPVPRSQPTLSRGTRPISHGVTAIWDATGGTKTTTIMP